MAESHSLAVAVEAMESVGGGGNGNLTAAAESLVAAMESVGGDGGNQIR